MVEGFEPRIVVSGDEDWSTVVAALCDYQVGLLTRVRAIGCGLPEALEQCRRATELLVILNEQRTAEAARELFGEVPDDPSGLGGENRD